MLAMFGLIVSAFMLWVSLHVCVYVSAMLECNAVACLFDCLFDCWLLSNSPAAAAVAGASSRKCTLSPKQVK